MDARGDLALRVSGGLERLSVGSGWRGYLYTFTSPAPAGLRLAAHARTGPAGDSDIPERGGQAQLLRTRAGAAGVVTSEESTVQVCCRRPVFPFATHRAGFEPPTVSRHEVSTLQVCCLRPVFPSVTHRAGFGPPTVSRHRVSTVQVCCLRPVFPSAKHREGFGPPTVSRHRVSTV